MMRRRCRIAATTVCMELTEGVESPRTEAVLYNYDDEVAVILEFSPTAFVLLTRATPSISIQIGILIERAETMDAPVDDATSTAVARLERCYSGQTCDWTKFYQPGKEMLNFATRYHLVYPALSYFMELKRNPDRAVDLRPRLDTIYRGLLEPRCWTYWHTELEEKTWPLQERNLTYAGRLATFVGFYIDAFGEPPAARIELGGRSTTYRDLSRSLWQQMAGSPSCGVSCYHHQSMVMCNAHMLINNLLHDRLFGTGFASANPGWLGTVEDHLLREDETGPLFFYGTAADSPEPIVKKRAVGADIWALFLMSSIVPDRVSAWFERSQRNIVCDGETAHVEVAVWEAENEFSSNELATAWAFCLAKELGQKDRAMRLRNSLCPQVLSGFELDPYISGLFLLGERLEAGAFHKLVNGTGGQN